MVITIGILFIPLLVLAQEDSIIIPKKNDGKWGYYNKQGEEVIKAMYDNVGNFYEGEKLAAVELDEKIGFIDRAGNLIIPLEYDVSIEKIISDELKKQYVFSASTFCFKDGIALVIKNGKWGGVDETGKEVIPFKYDFIGDFNEDGEAFAQIDDKYIKIEKTGIEKSINYRTGLPVEIKCADETFLIVDVSAGKEDGKTVIILTSFGISDVIKWSVLYSGTRMPSFIHPINCSFITKDREGYDKKKRPITIKGREYLAQTIRYKRRIHAIFGFNTTEVPDRVVFYSEENPTEKTIIKLIEP